MLIPFGFLASAGGAAGSYELISTTLLGSTTASVTFTNGGAWAGYKHLQVRVTGRIATAAGTGGVDWCLRFNGNASEIYAFHYLNGNGSTVTSFGAGTQNKIVFIASMPSATLAAGIYNAAVIDILDFAGTKNKTVRSFVGTPGNNWVALNSGLWESTAALTSLTFFDTSALNFAAGSRFSLYGIKG